MKALKNLLITPAVLVGLIAGISFAALYMATKWVLTSVAKVW